ILNIKSNIKFNRHELAGAFGDLGTDLPLIVGVILAADLRSTDVLVIFGVMQILTALYYQIPMPVQPLKAMSALVIAQKLDGSILYGAGVAIGLIMLLLSLTGGLDWLARIVDKSIIRGIQFGLGLQLSLLALKDYIPSQGINGYILATIAFFITVIFISDRHYPAAILVIILGLIYALTSQVNLWELMGQVSFQLPQWQAVSRENIVTGFLLLALPQIPLSLGNSILATKQIATDLFPEKPISIRQISLSYSLINLVSPWFGGMPTCHGSGGMAGHYAFGGRTGGSVIIYGSIYLIIGLFFGPVFQEIVKVFPLPILGILLLFEGLTLILLLKDLTESTTKLSISILVGLIACSLPYGYLIGMIIGLILVYLTNKYNLTLG
ncbi:MAG: putative sulfate/molybdate transporter, partial [Microcoleaceae cyanobacterium]